MPDMRVKRDPKPRKITEKSLNSRGKERVLQTKERSHTQGLESTAALKAGRQRSHTHPIFRGSVNPGKATPVKPSVTREDTVRCTRCHRTGLF